VFLGNEDIQYVKEVQSQLKMPTPLKKDMAQLSLVEENINIDKVRVNAAQVS
jgi:hypothetical protein